MEVASNSFALVEQPGGSVLFVKARVLNSNASGGREAYHQFLVDVGEHLTICLVGEVEVAVDDAAQADGYAEKRRHRRVAGGETERLWMRLEIRQPQRPGLEDQ